MLPGPVRPSRLAAFVAFAAGTVASAMPLIGGHLYAVYRALEDYGDPGGWLLFFLVPAFSLVFGAVISGGCASVASMMYGRWCHSARGLALVPLRVLGGVLLVLGVLGGLSWLRSSWVPAPGIWMVFPAAVALSFWIAFLAYWVTWLGLGGGGKNR